MKFKTFKSSVQSKFAKARSVVMVFAASMMLPIAAGSVRAVVTEAGTDPAGRARSEEHTSELQSRI